ncbi:MAG: PDZ domain-containing protein [Alkalispirochaetaceae bacterium]
MPEGHHPLGYLPGARLAIIEVDDENRLIPLLIHPVKDNLARVGGPERTRPGVLIVKGQHPPEKLIRRLEATENVALALLGVPEGRFHEDLQRIPLVNVTRLEVENCAGVGSPEVRENPGGKRVVLRPLLRRRGEGGSEALPPASRGGGRGCGGGGGEFADLGLSVEPLDADRREALELDEQVSGVVVTGVAGGPAAEAGLSPGDVITRVNRETIENVADLREILETVESGRSVPLLVLRDQNQRFLALRMP